MPLMIVKASEVREGEPRYWYTTEQAAVGALPYLDVSELHLCPLPDGVRAASVDRPATPAPDPREEAFWSAVFCADIATLPADQWDDCNDSSRAEIAGGVADAALVEWRKRWGAK